MMYRRLNWGCKISNIFIFVVVFECVSDGEFLANLTIKEPSKTAADDTFIFFHLLSFEEKKA